MSSELSRSISRMPVVGLVAHDQKKDDLEQFCVQYRDTLSHFELVATGTTGRRIAEATGLPVTCYLSGPLGGDAQLAARVAQEEVAALLFLVDPLYAHPHEPDIQGLLRVCNVYDVPLATNLATAKIIVRALSAELEAR